MQADVDQHNKHAEHAKHAKHAKHADADFCQLTLVIALQALHAGPAQCDSDDAGRQASADVNPEALPRAVFQWEGSSSAPATRVHATLSHVRPLVPCLPLPFPPEGTVTVSCTRAISHLAFLAHDLHPRAGAITPISHRISHP